MLVEPIIFTNLYKEQLLLATGKFTDVTVSDEWSFSRPKLYYNTIIKTFKDLKESIDDTDSLYMIHIDSFGLPQLKNLILEKQKRDEVNKKGLKIFLTEILIKYQGNETQLYRQSLNSISDTSYKKFRFDYNDDPIKCIQLDNISTFVKNNNLTNVVVYTIEKDYKNVFRHYKTFKIKYYDLFLKAHIKRMKDCVAPVDLAYKFLCTNFRYAPHRYLMAAFLIRKNSKISWAYSGTVNKLQNLLLFDLKKSKYFYDIEKGIDALNSAVPLSLDLTFERENITGKIKDLFLLPTDDLKEIPENAIGVYDDIFCSIVCESEFFEVTSNVSEKTLSAIQHKKPFVILGAPETLRLLKEMGFKTFDKYWSEEYDEFYDSEKRFESVCDVIKYIDTLSLTQCKELLLDMKPILEHNYSRFKELQQRYIE